MRALALAAAFLLLALPARAQGIIGPGRSGSSPLRRYVDGVAVDDPGRVEGLPWACGVAAWGELVQLVAGKNVSCEARDVDRYGRTVAVCSADGQDINAAMVAQGWALAYRQFSDDYVGQEGKAQKEGLGMWRGEFVAPWDWRRGDRL